jgi:oligoendopeptidase F
MTEEAKKQALRSEIPEEMTWDLSPLYSNTDKWENDFSKINSMLKEFQTFKGCLSESPETLSEALKKDDKLDRLIEKTYVYAHLKSDEDIGNSENRGRLDRIESRYADIQGQTAWFEPELLEMPDEKFEAFLNAPALSFYKRTLQEIKRSKQHTLSAKEERLLGMASDALSTPQKTFSMLNNADIKFPTISDGDGNKVELTHGNYIKYLEDGKREVRQAAFNGMYETFTKFRNTISSTLDGAVKTHVLNAKIRNFPSALEASLHSDNIPLQVYNNLIDTVHKNLPKLHDYFKLRTETLKLDKLDMFDIYNPLTEDYKVEATWEEACEWVRQACKPMGEEYCGILEKAFSERWIDVLECQGKRSGAYSSGCYDSNPYVLMNYNGTLNDVFTLAHELGHSMHSYYSREAQDYHYADYRIFVAEVASTTNELLLHDYLMKKTNDNKMKVYLLNHLADQFRGTIYRQTMFAEFEKMIHEHSEKSIPLTADKFCELYFELNAKYHGESVNPDKLIQMEWARIPHFYYNFYVYKYATGLSAAAALSKNILSGDKTKLDAYMGFLKAGDSKDVLDIMRDAGVDLSTPEPVNTALEQFEKTVGELSERLKK